MDDRNYRFLLETKTNYYNSLLLGVLSSLFYSSVSNIPVRKNATASVPTFPSAKMQLLPSAKTQLLMSEQKMAVHLCNVNVPSMWAKLSPPRSQNQRSPSVKIRFGAPFREDLPLNPLPLICQYFFATAGPESFC